MSINMTTSDQSKLVGYLTGKSHESIKRFCERLPDLQRSTYPEALVGMGYQYESFDHMFALIAANVQATVDETDYEARYWTMQNVLQPFASEYAIEPDRPLANPHRKLYADFYTKATGKPWPSHYPKDSDSLWLQCGRRWANTMIENLEHKHLDAVDKAKYNLGYHWSVEHLSIDEFDQLKEAWGKIGITAPYMQAHCDVEEEHADCATMAVASFGEGMIDDPLVQQGVRDHEDDLAGFYDECVGLIDRRRGSVQAA